MYVTVSIVLGTKEIRKWTMYHVLPEYTLHSECQCYLSQDIKLTNKVSVPLEFNVLECCEANGKCIRFSFTIEVAECSAPSSSCRNAADVLMSSARALHLPKKIDSISSIRGDNQLYNDIICFMSDKSLGFHAGTEQTSGKQIVVALQKILFYIEPHLRTLNGRKANFVPVYFQPLIRTVHNNPTSHGHAVKALERNKLETLSRSIFDCLSLPALSARNWYSFKSALEELAVNVTGYIHYLESSSERVAEVHRSPTPVRSPTDGSSSSVQLIHANKARKPELVARYKDVESALWEKGEYSDPVFVNDYAPTNSQRRYLYFKEFCLPFNCELYSYAYGNNLGSLWFAWRIPFDPAKQDSHKAKILMDNIEKGIKIYHTREMRRQFCNRYHLLAKTSPAVLIDMYQCLTGDVSSTSISEGVRDRLKVMLDSQDPDVWFDLRHQNSGQPEKYEEFWKAVDAVINESALKAVDSRRHGTVCHMALALSVRNLRDKVLEKNPTLVAPSIEWLRYQFSPQNEYKKTAMRYTGRLNIKFMVQSRQLSFDHPDNHYTAAIFKYMREFSIKFRSYCLFVCIDDKHSIKYGEPGYPVAAVERGKQVLVAVDKPFVVSDHDFTKAKITPSVSLVCDIPMSVEESFYRGQVFVGLKDSIFQLSSPFRHGAELYNILYATSKPILCLYSDGGPDHRVTYLSVQLSLICLFRALDLDYLIAARTAPHNSFRNPVERIMSVLNIGLQAVGIMREEMSDEFEEVLKRANSMEEIRKLATQKEGFKSKFLSSMSPPIELIKSTFSYLDLKGSPVQSMEPATDEDIEKLFAKIIPIDSSAQMTDTYSKNFRNRKKLQEYIDHCCVRRQYYFAIRKCGVADCAMCLPPKLPPEIFQQLCAFPDPMKASDSSESYLPFESVYGQLTSEKFRPSLKSKPSTSSEKPFRLSAETVADAVVCSECLKPRCVYSIRRLTREEFQSLACVKEDVFFVCGGPLFPEMSGLSQICCVEPNITCNSFISVHYYSCRKKFQICCHVCGCFADLVPITDEMRRKFQTIHPVCTDCQQSGNTERTRGPRFTGQKRKRK